MSHIPVLLKACIQHKNVCVCVFVCTPLPALQLVRCEWTEERSTNNGSSGQGERGVTKSTKAFTDARVF